MTTHAEMLSRLANEAEITKAAAGRIVDHLTRIIIADLLLDGRSALQGLGIFTLKERQARKFNNPQTGVPVEKPARKTITFKPTKAVKEQIQQ